MYLYTLQLPQHTKLCYIHIQCAGAAVMCMDTLSKFSTSRGLIFFFLAIWLISSYGFVVKCLAFEPNGRRVDPQGKLFRKNK